MQSSRNGSAQSAEGRFDGSGAQAAVGLGAAADHVYDGRDRTSQ